jgi:hypothetical protein
MPCDFKETVYQQKLNRTLYTGLDRTISKLNFSKFGEKNLLSACIEKSVKIKQILVKKRAP